MNLKITSLVLDRLRSLGQEAMTIHEDMEKWRKEPLEIQERTILSVRHSSRLEEQRSWIDALEEVFEIEEKEG